MMIVVSNFLLILKIYATLPILAIHVDFERFRSFISIILMVLMMTEFTKEIISRLKMFYNENGQKSRNCKSFEVKFDTYSFDFTSLV